MVVLGKPVTFFLFFCSGLVHDQAYSRTADHPSGRTKNDTPSFDHLPKGFFHFYCGNRELIKSAAHCPNKNEKNLWEGGQNWVWPIQFAFVLFMSAFKDFTIN